MVESDLEARVRQLEESSDTWTMQLINRVLLIYLEERAPGFSVSDLRNWTLRFCEQLYGRIPEDVLEVIENTFQPPDESASG